MPSISKIRLTNVVYEDGEKRFNDELFLFDGHNGAILLENGGGKTVFIHTVLQAILPHVSLGERKIKETLQLDNAPAHIGIEWILHDNPRRYVTTAVSLFLQNDKLNSLRYVYEYNTGDRYSIESIPFVKDMHGKKRPAYKEEMMEYYGMMRSRTHNAVTFSTIHEFNTYIEEQYHIIQNEWESIVKINRDEGGIEQFFENCKTTTDLYDRLLIPTVEESIIGHEKGIFADMFEKQRDGFHMYKKLQASMLEHKQIQEQLEKYVVKFEQFSLKQKAYQHARERVKGLWHVIQDQQQTIEQELTQNKTDWDHWKEETEKHHLKVDSYEIIIEQIKEKELQTAFNKALAIYEQSEERLQLLEADFRALKYAASKKELKMHEEQLADYEKEKLAHDGEDKAVDYEAEMEEENGKLLGYFQEKIDEFNRLLTALNVEIRPITDEIMNLQAKKRDLTDQYEETNEAVIRTNERIRTQREKVEQIKHKILANPAQENVREQLLKWQERYQWLDEEIIRLHKQIKDDNLEIEKITDERSRLQQKMNDIAIHLANIKKDKELLQGAHDGLIEALVTIRPSWGAINDIFLKQSSVYESLLNIRKKQNREREELFAKERQARRFVDDYGQQDIFFSDNYLFEKISDWRNQLYVVPGVEYYDGLPTEHREAFSTYPLWPITLVTIETDKEKLITKLTTIKENLQYPIVVLTQEEMKEIGQKQSETTWITPAYWESNLVGSQFTEWKEQLDEIAKQLTEKRVQKEQEMEHVNRVIDQFENFFQTYPRSKKEELIEQENSFRLEKETFMRKDSHMNTIIQQLREQIVAAEDNKEKFRDEKSGLEGHIEKAMDCIQIEKEMNNLLEIKQADEEILSRLEKEQHELDHQLERFEEEKQAIGERIRDNQAERKIIEADRDYKEVKTATPIFSGEEKEVILRRRDNLKLQLHRIRQSYGELIAKCEHEKEHIQRISKDLQDMEEMYGHFDKEIVFPPDGERQIKQIQAKIKMVNNDVTSNMKKRDKAKEEHVKQRTTVELLMKQFQEKYQTGDVYQFSIPIDTVEKALNDEKEKLQKRKTYVSNETKRLEKEQQNIEKANIKLNNFEELHRFQSTTIVASTLTENEIIEFTYARIDYVQNVTKELRETFEQLVEGKEEIEQARRHFRNFCHETITDSKMRQMAIQGIEVKETYEDILQFQKNMLITVERADQYARDYISENDKEIQAFINSIHNHLLNVVEQLQVIPKKTKVKIADNWREIYSFTIPEWTEEDGKSRIRKHIDWILEQLESEQYLTNEGLEDHGKVRKDIETWLDTKQLLQVVMDYNVMKVSCRKVTNDNQVTRRSYSWEQSNQWSGGEKWSKNMTLFLGILNFVAEKKQHIQPTMKHHRAVILDNPFGKASSDHVLSPVFFIAEQLGFQMIALTAHADGKFLQDYFPIIYSCRLRPSKDDSKQIMTKEKRLHHAYFQDHDPAPLERLEEREQLELFD